MLKNLVSLVLVGGKITIFPKKGTPDYAPRPSTDAAPDKPDRENNAPIADTRTRRYARDTPRRRKREDSRS